MDTAPAIDLSFDEGLDATGYAGVRRTGMPNHARVQKPIRVTVAAIVASLVTFCLPGF
jgi:hypothetical protein